MTADLDKFHSGIREFVKRYQQNPFDFLYEADIRALLAAELWHRFSEVPLSLRGGYWYPAIGGTIGAISTVPIKCEYPGERFDIALIDRTSPRHFDAAQARLEGWRSDTFWNQPVRAAIEIKCCQVTDDARRRRQDLDTDVRKLANYLDKRGDKPFLGLAMIFVQSDSFDTTSFVSSPPSDEAHSRPAIGIFRCVVTPSRWILTAP